MLFCGRSDQSKGDGEYLGKTLYKMVGIIQKFLNVNKINWKPVDGPNFGELRVVLDNVMKDRASKNIGMVVK